MDEPNEKPTNGRSDVGHDGKRQPAKSRRRNCISARTTTPAIASRTSSPTSSAARPIHLAIIDGVESIAGGEGPWIRGVRVVKPGVLIAGLNPVCTDAVATAVMGYNPRATRGTPPFRNGDNTLLLAEAHGVGTTDLKRIEVRGVSDRAGPIPLRC